MPGKYHGQRGLAGYSPWGRYRVGHDLVTKQQQQIWKILLPDSSVGKESACNAGDPCIPVFNSWVGKIPWRRDRLPTPVFMGFPCGSAGKESTCNVGDLGSIPGLRRSPGERKGYPLQYPGRENSMDYTVHGVAKSQTRLSDFHFHFHFLSCALESYNLSSHPRSES